MSIHFGALRFGQLANRTMYVDSLERKQAFTVQDPIAPNKNSSPVKGWFGVDPKKQFIAEFHRVVDGFPELTTVQLDEEAKHTRVRVRTLALDLDKYYTILLDDGTILPKLPQKPTQTEIINREMISDTLALRDRLRQAIEEELQDGGDVFEMRPKS